MTKISDPLGPATIVKVAAHRPSPLRRLRRYTQDRIAHYGIKQVVLAPLGALSLASTFFAFALRSRTAVTAIVIAILVATWIGVLFIADLLHRDRKSVRKGHEVVRRLTELLLQQQTPQAYKWKSWEDHMIISRNGDTAVQQWRVLEASDQVVAVAWTALVQSYFGDLTDRDRRAVTVTAHSYHVDASGHRVMGVAYELVPVWREDADALAVYLCFDHPVSPGGERPIVFTWTWPGFHRRLLRGEPDEIFFVRKRGFAGLINQRLTFDRSCHVTGNLALRPYEHSPMPALYRHADGAVTLDAKYGPDLPETVGFTVQIHQ